MDGWFRVLDIVVVEPEYQSTFLLPSSAYFLPDPKYQTFAVLLFISRMAAAFHPAHTSRDRCALPGISFSG